MCWLMRICLLHVRFPGKRAKREGMLLYDMFREARILKRADEHICLVVTGPNLAAFLTHPDLQVWNTLVTQGGCMIKSCTFKLTDGQEFSLFLFFLDGFYPVAWEPHVAMFCLL